MPTNTWEWFHVPIGNYFSCYFYKCPPIPWNDFSCYFNGLNAHPTSLSPLLIITCKGVSMKILLQVFIDTHLHRRGLETGARRWDRRAGPCPPTWNLYPRWTSNKKKNFAQTDNYGRRVIRSKTLVQGIHPNKGLCLASASLYAHDW